MDTKALRQKILDLAIRGKLVPQDPNDEPASVLLERIRAEKERLIAEGKIKRPKKSKASSSESHYQKFEIPNSWEWTTLGEIFSMQAGKNIQASKLKEYSDEAPYPCYGGNGIRGYLPKYNHEGLYPIVGRQGALCGNINMASGKFYATEHAVVVDYFANTEPLLWRYFLEFLNLNQYATATAQPGLSVAKIEEVPIPLPPIQEQTRIIKAVESWFERITLLEKNIISLNECISTIKSKILELAMQGKLIPQDPADEPATDMLRRVNPKARIITDNPHYPQLPDNWVLTTIESVCNYGKCISVSVEDIKDDEWILELEDIEKDSGRVIEKKKKYCRNVNGVRHKFNEGEVLYSKLRTYLNKVLLAKEDGYCTTEIIPILCNDSILPQYLCHWLRSPYYLNYTLSCGYGIKMPRLSTTDARNGIVPLPPLNEQMRILLRLSDYSRLLEVITNSLS